MNRYNLFAALLRKKSRTDRAPLHVARWAAICALVMSSSVFAATPVPTLQGTPEAKVLSRDFPLLAKLLMANRPWEMAPHDLAQEISERMPALAQGSKDVPLLFSDRREKGWEGEPLFGLHAYETEFYVFDREQPLVRLHVGRPLVFGFQHGRTEALAKGKEQASEFPVLAPEVVTKLLARLDTLADALARFGAQREPCASALVTCYQLPNDVRMTLTNLSGSTNGTPYVEITLTPQKPVAKFTGSQTLAFPGAEGAGRYALGGRGGKVYEVTTLKDYLSQPRPGRPEGTYGQASDHATEVGAAKVRPYIDALGKPVPGVAQPLLPAFPPLPKEDVIRGSLREAVEASGPRYVVFAVSGTIELKDELVIRNPYITIAGQTAPGAGIQIKNFGVMVEAHDVILRYLRIRVGETKGPGKLQRTLGEQTHGMDLSAINVIVDHCEIAYANDQIFNTYGVDRREGATLQWSYIYGGPKKSTHEKGDHSMTNVGVGWGFVSLHHNLIAHSRLRNPRVDMLTYDFRNNVIYNFEETGYGSPNDNLRLNYIGNTLKRGPDTKRKDLHAFGDTKFTTAFGQWYGEGNQLPEGFVGLFNAPAQTIVNRPHQVAPVTTHTAAQAYQLVLAQGGANKPVRDSITRYVASTVINGTGFIPGTPADWPNGGFAHYPKARATKDKNHNGIADAWERKHGLKLNKTQATGRDLDPRYDNIEVYMNAL